MRDCEQRVRLLEMTTGIAPSDEKADGTSLDGHGGHRPAGVEARAGCATTPEILVSAAPPQHMRVFSTLTEFYREFKRTAKQEFVEYEFRKNLTPGGHRREVGGLHEGLYWLLEKASLSAELFVSKSCRQLVGSITTPG